MGGEGGKGSGSGGEPAHKGYFSLRSRTGLAGLPAQRCQGGRSEEKTLERAPRTTPSGMMTPGATKTSAASQTLAPSVIGAVVRGWEGSSKSWLAVQRKE